MRSVIVRDVTEKDVKRVLEIYSFYIENTAISFECEVPRFLSFALVWKTLSSAILIL